MLFLCALVASAVAGSQAVNTDLIRGDVKATNEAAHWSLLPLLRLSPPQVQRRDWGRTAIDAFVLARLEEKKLSPGPQADRRTLLRRVTFDLIGLPPSPDDMSAFLADSTPGAYERVVDQLLASPRYGERWARHWMDAIHFAETHGHDQDRIRTNAWPYRDYLVDSFNQDKGYRRFVEEQLAGDILFPDDPAATVALGFIAAGPWDESSLRDIREDTVDRQVARYLDRDDMVTTTMSTLLSTTAHCARCHQHKFDPISQEDYYSLQAVFAGTDRADRVYDPDPRVHARRQQLLRRRRDLERRDPAFLASLTSLAVQAEIAAELDGFKSRGVDWIKPELISAVSSNSTVLTPQPDGSLVAGGPRPDKEIYVLRFRATLASLTGVRVEVLTDTNLPHLGPGRQDNGNLHLSEVKLLLEPAAGAGPARRLAISQATADFNQDGWTAAHAIDGQENTAWGIYPKVGQAHRAAFELKEEEPFPPGATLTVVLEQLHGGGHLIGRPRVSLTSSRHPTEVEGVPEEIARILAMPPGQRTAEQVTELGIHALKIRTAKELAALGPARKVYAGASDFSPDGGLVPARAPRAVHVLKRGDIHKPGAEAGPGALSAVASLSSRFALADPTDEAARRAALARWIIDPHNPLTWRSVVNRVWHWHFGSGLVDTPNDFGEMGSLPSHRELLDWLACWFLDHGGSFKAMHRLVVTSAAYQQSSATRLEGETADADNRWLWRMNRSRLDAESVRDAILQATGQMDLRMGGPSDQQFALSPGIHVTPVVDYAAFDIDSAGSHRRSIYRFLFRTLPDPFMDSLDCPDGSQLAPTRGASVTALQALSMLNNRFVVRQSQHLAGRVESLRGGLSERIVLACDLTLGRPPTAAEAGEFETYVRRHGLVNLCRLLFNSNEFMFIH